MTCKNNINNNKKYKKYKSKKKILVNALIIKVCKDNNIVPSPETTSGNFVSKVAKVQESL